MGSRATSLSLEPFSVSLHIPDGSACGQERDGLGLCELRLCELFMSSLADHKLLCLSHEEPVPRVL